MKIFGRKYKTRKQLKAELEEVNRRLLCSVRTIEHVQLPIKTVKAEAFILHEDELPYAKEQIAYDLGKAAEGFIQYRRCSDNIYAGPQIRILGKLDVVVHENQGV